MVQRLQELNTHFYQQQGESFACTRGAPWHGWKRCVEILHDKDCFQNERPYSVLDFACGNMRFEDFLRNVLPDVDIAYCGMDNSSQMAAGRTFYNVDLLELLIESNLSDSSNALPDILPCDLTASFGFMHHIPGHSLRLQLLKNMAERTRPNGHIIVSFWQFLNSPNLTRKAENTHQAALLDLSQQWNMSPAELNAALDGGDYFLGWQGKSGAYRYCHSFPTTEIDLLIKQISDKAQLVARFDADGHTQNLNSYIVLKKRKDD
ncbi:MAG: class I SAM-dependent methyltransferase [Coriobacteriia bacterium]|nr:class I SAM-dependent methyltransferase [Coriobacteriia bacterium]